MKQRSFFFPLALIAVGTLWLLNGLGIVPSANLWALAHFVPFLLIGLGLGLILSAYWQYGRLLMSVLVVGGAVLAVVFAPQLGWAGTVPLGWNFNIGQNFNGRLNGSGVIKSETTKLDDLDAITMSYPGKVTVKQGESNSITITADDNLLPQLTAEVTDGELRIRNTESDWNKRVSPSKTVVVVITVKQVHKLNFASAGELVVQGLNMDTVDLSVSGAGNVTLTDLKTDRLEVSLSGAGSITVDGTAKTLDLRMSGFGEFKGPDLETQQADVRITGAGSATVWAVNELNASISGAGNVSYYGDPKAVKHVSGAGNINRIGSK